MRTSTNHLLRQRVEDATFLADNGVGITEAARRLGMNHAESLRDYLTIRGHRDLARRLAANEPVSA